MKASGASAGAIILVLCSCVAPRPDTVSGPAHYANQEAIFFATTAYVMQKGNDASQVSGHIYCGEGIFQRPANMAKIELLEGEKTLVTSTSDMDGKYKLEYKKGISNNHHFQISARCGKTKETTAAQTIKNKTEIDFWIK